VEVYSIVISAQTARQLIGETLKARGLRGRGSLWRYLGPDVQWIIHIDELPYGQRLGIDVGLDLQAVEMRRMPTECPILLHLENMPLAADLDVFASLDLDSNLTADARIGNLTAALDALIDYVSRHQTLEQVREAYRAGDFRSAFIHKDTRASLEQRADRTDV
jgi:hypothetical protein